MTAQGTAHCTEGPAQIWNMDLSNGLWSAGRALVPLRCLITPRSSSKHLADNRRHHCSQQIPQRTSKNIPVHSISFSLKLTSCLRNENHLEGVLAKLHPGTEEEQRSFDPRVAESTERKRGEEERDVVLGEEKQLLWIGEEALQRWEWQQIQSSPCPTYLQSK